MRVTRLEVQTHLFEMKDLCLNRSAFATLPLLQNNIIWAHILKLNLQWDNAFANFDNANGTMY